MIEKTKNNNIFNENEFKETDLFNNLGSSGQAFLRYGKYEKGI